MKINIIDDKNRFKHYKHNCLVLNQIPTKNLINIVHKNNIIKYDITPDFVFTGEDSSLNSVKSNIIKLANIVEDYNMCPLYIFTNTSYNFEKRFMMDLYEKELDNNSFPLLIKFIEDIVGHCELFNRDDFYDFINNY